MRKPQDLTIRNAQASKKRDDALLARIRKLEAAMKSVNKVLRKYGLK